MTLNPWEPNSVPLRHGWIHENGSLTFTHHKLLRIPDVLWKLYGNNTKTANFSCNSIYTLAYVDKFVYLTDLILDDNEISEAVEYPAIKSLRYLSLNKNMIKDIVVFVRKIRVSYPKLTFLSLLGNDACPYMISEGNTDAEYQRYRYYVLHFLSGLKHLDCTPVNETELKTAKIKGQLMYTRRPMDISSDFFGEHRIIYGMRRDPAAPKYGGSPGRPFATHFGGLAGDAYDPHFQDFAIMKAASQYYGLPSTSHHRELPRDPSFSRYKLLSEITSSHFKELLNKPSTSHRKPPTEPSLSRYRLPSALSTSRYRELLSDPSTSRSGELLSEPSTSRFKFPSEPSTSRSTFLSEPSTSRSRFPSEPSTSRSRSSTSRSEELSSVPSTSQYIGLPGEPSTSHYRGPGERFTPVYRALHKERPKDKFVGLTSILETSRFYDAYAALLSDDNPPVHRGTYIQGEFRSANKESEGNRFISNDFL